MFGPGASEPGPAEGHKPTAADVTEGLADATFEFWAAITDETSEGDSHPELARQFVEAVEGLDAGAGDLTSGHMTFLESLGSTEFLRIQAVVELSVAASAAAVEDGHGALKVALLRRIAQFSTRLLGAAHNATTVPPTRLRDASTGLLRKEAFQSDFVFWLDRGTAFVVGMIDLDGLKEVNDREGHQAGDELIRRIAELLLEATKPRGEAYRWGGDEFVVLVDLESVEIANAWADQIELADNVPSFSRGFALCPAEAEDVNDAFRLADFRMFENKGQHKAAREAHTSHQAEPHT
jgi:diguanylate cyclase (GGDEF)-like protein